MLYQRIFSTPVIGLFILLICFFVYYPSVDVPFYLDDFDSIVDNLVIRTVDIAALNQSFPLREVGYLTFAINYAYTESDLAPLHITNILLHLLMGGGVYLLARELINIAKIEAVKPNHVAIMAMAFFLFSPINSQAVIYVVQRLAIVVALFYTLGIISYIKLRTSHVIWQRSLWFVICLGSFFLGLHSKQNIVTFPVVVLVIEFFLIRPERLSKLPKYIVTSLLVGLMFWLADFIFRTGILNQINALTQEADRVTRWEYFTHQLTAIWVYIFKFIVPAPLQCYLV